MLWSFENQIRIFFINVNMSAKQLERKTFCGVVMALLKETGFPAGQLCLELTERCRKHAGQRYGRKNCCTSNNME